MGDSAARDLARDESKLTLDSAKRMARYDAKKIKRLRIASPDTGKMHRVTYGNTTYCFRNKKKMYEFIENNGHYKLMNIKVDPEDRQEPIIHEKR